MVWRRWGDVVLTETEPGEYEGTYTDTFKDKPGKIQLQWSRLEGRYKGTWREGKDRFGKISLRLVDDEIRGAWTTNEESRIAPGSPELADLLWTRDAQRADPPALPAANSGSIARRSPAASGTPNLQGVVIELQEQELVEISLGSDDGLRVKDMLDVHRDKTYLGRVSVVRVEADRSVARIESRQGEIRKGDRVILLAHPDKAASGTSRVPRISMEDSVTDIAYSPDGKLLAVANDSPAVQIVDVTSGDIALTLKLSTAEEDAVLAATEHMNRFAVTALAFSPVGDVLVVGTSIGQVKLYNAKTGELLRRSTIRSRGWPTRKRRKTGSRWFARSAVSDRWRFRPMADWWPSAASRSATSRTSSTASRACVARTSGPGRLKVFDAQTGKLVHDLPAHSQAWAVAISGDNEWLASTGRWADGADHGGGVIVWNLKTGDKRTTLANEANGGIHAVVFSPTRKMIALSALHFDKENDTRRTSISVAFPLSGITEWEQSIPGGAAPKAFSPDGRRLIVLSGRESIRIVNVETGQLQHEFKPEGQGGRWSDLAVSPQGLIAISGTSADGRVVIEIMLLPDSPRDR